MSTWTDSRYVIARKRHVCAWCFRSIAQGERYLAFKPGLRTMTPACVQCVERDPSRWRCAATDPLVAAQEAMRSCSPLYRAFLRENGYASDDMRPGLIAKFAAYIERHD